MSDFKTTPSVGDEIAKGRSRYRFDGVGWSPVARSSVAGSLVVTQIQWFYLLSAGQTEITGVDLGGKTLSYSTSGQDEILVYLNGIRIRKGSSQDYVLTSGSVLTLTDAGAAGDEIEIIQRARFASADYYEKSEIDTSLAGKVDDSQVLTNVPSGALFTDTNTTYSVGDGGLSEKNFTSADNTKLDGIDTSANNYSHPGTHPASMLTGALPAIDGSNLTGIATAPPYASAPAVATEGKLYYNTTAGILYVSNGTIWEKVSNPAPLVTGGTVAIPNVTEGTNLSYNVGLDFTDESDADSSLAYTLNSGELPPGVTLPSTGSTLLSGVANNTLTNQNVTYVFAIRGTDTGGAFAIQNYSVTITNVAVGVTGGTVTISTVNEGISTSYDVDTDFTFGSGRVFAAYTLQSGTLPSGLSLTAASGIISGVTGNVSSNTVYTFTIRGTDTDGDTADQVYSWTINTVAPSASAGTKTLSTVTESQAVSYDVDADFTFGTSRVFSAYSHSSGSLPSGVSLNTTSGVLSGTAGNVSSNTAYSFNIRATDTDGDVVDKAYSWSINTAGPSSTGGTVSISSVNENASASYDVDNNFSYPTGSVRKSSGAYSLQSGVLPSGLSLNSTSGVISGIMGDVSSTTGYSFTIRATDTDGDTADQAYSWTINNVPLTGTGGTVNTYSGYKSNTFTSSGSITFNQAGTIDVLVVAGGASGGGAGGNDGSGGGGAGGMLVGSLSVSAGTTYNVTIGAGASGVWNSTRGYHGSNSSFTGITTAIGGGGGGSEGGTRTGDNGGSGGGSGGYGANGGGSGTSGQGNSGGQGTGPGDGGGGGKGSAGSNGITGHGGSGGANNYRTGSNIYYAGGGGSSADWRRRTSGGNGGNGGGGNGAPDYGTAVSGTANTGGGGGGAVGRNRGGTKYSGNGGSGIVVVRYAQ